MCLLIHCYHQYINQSLRKFSHRDTISRLQLWLSPDRNCMLLAMLYYSYVTQKPNNLFHKYKTLKLVIRKIMQEFSEELNEIKCNIAYTLATLDETQNWVHNLIPHSKMFTYKSQLMYFIGCLSLFSCRQKVF